MVPDHDYQNVFFFIEAQVTRTLTWNFDIVNSIYMEDQMLMCRISQHLFDCLMFRNIKAKANNSNIPMYNTEHKF